MKNTSTKYNNKEYKGLRVFSFFISLTFILLLIFLFVKVLNMPEEADFYSIRGLLLLVIGFISVLMLSAFFGSIIGILTGRAKVAIDNNAIKKSNPYIYYRELPNNFGIGVTSLLMDSAIENYKDIVAVILDLCARKYLTLIKQSDKYIIKIIRGIDNSLLSNEKYILDLVMNNNIKNIDYEKWYTYCMQDGLMLGLYYHQELNINENANLNKNSTILTAIPDLLSIIKESARVSTQVNYKNIIENNLSKTQKGIEELHKLQSFHAFLRDFGLFASRNPEEVVLWDRYLSYAQLFGLTKEIMKSGYNQLVNNASFQIDNIDNINLDNLYTITE